MCQQEPTSVCLGEGWPAARADCDVREMGEVPRIRVDRRSLADLRKSSSTITRLFGVRLILEQCDAAAEKSGSCRAQQRAGADERSASALDDGRKETDDALEPGCCSHRGRNENEVVVHLEMLHGALSGSFCCDGERGAAGGGGGGGSRVAASGEHGNTLDDGLDAASRSVLEIAARVQVSFFVCFRFGFFFCCTIAYPATVSSPLVRIRFGNSRENTNFRKSLWSGSSEVQHCSKYMKIISQFS